VLLCADGTTLLLERPPDRLLGVSPGAARHDHTGVLHPGDTVLFYTDGLVEQREMVLDDGTAWLVRELARIGREPLERLCDDLLAGMSGPIDDDVALLAVRIAAAGSAAAASGAARGSPAGPQGLADPVGGLHEQRDHVAPQVVDGRPPRRRRGGQCGDDRT
jgi:hypothetical protein